MFAGMSDDQPQLSDKARIQAFLDGPGSIFFALLATALVIGFIVYAIKSVL